MLSISRAFRIALHCSAAFRAVVSRRIMLAHQRGKNAFLCTSFFLMHCYGLASKQESRGCLLSRFVGKSMLCLFANS